MQLEQLQSVYHQLSQQMDSTPETIIKSLLPEPGSLGREDNSISETCVELDQGKIFDFTSRLVNNKKREYEHNFSPCEQVHFGHTGSKL